MYDLNCLNSNRIGAVESQSSAQVQGQRVVAGLEAQSDPVFYDVGVWPRRVFEGDQHARADFQASREDGEEALDHNEHQFHRGGDMITLGNISLGSRTPSQSRRSRRTCPAGPGSARWSAWQGRTGSSAASAALAGSAGCSPALPFRRHTRYAPARCSTSPPASAPFPTRYRVAEISQKNLLKSSGFRPRRL